MIYNQKQSQKSKATMFPMQNVENLKDTKNGVEDNAEEKENEL